MASEQVIAKLSATVEALTNVVGELRADFRANTERQNDLATQLAGIKASQETLCDNYAVLAKLVRDGNGQPSLMQRITTIETAHKQHGDDIAELKSHFNDIATARVLSRGQIIAGVLGMVITALMSLGAILAQLLKP